jgi:hypothetical protein
MCESSTYNFDFVVQKLLNHAEESSSKHTLQLLSGIIVHVTMMHSDRMNELIEHLLKLLSESSAQVIFFSEFKEMLIFVTLRREKLHFCVWVSLVGYLMTAIILESITLFYV